MTDEQKEFEAEMLAENGLEVAIKEWFAQAKRYRYLRDAPWDLDFDQIIAAQGDGAEEWDKMIDEAIAKPERASSMMRIGGRSDCKTGKR